MCALIKKELGFPLEAEREEDWVNVVGPNVLTLLLYAISDKLNFVLEMSAFLILLTCSQPVAKNGISNHSAKKAKTCFK